MGDPLADFIDAACVPLDASHASGTLERAEAILAASPEVAKTSVHAAAILGDEAGVGRFLAADPGSATARGGPRGWDALTHLCFSRYLRLDRSRAPGFLQAARALLDGGASASTGFYSPEHQPEPEFETVLYGAAGVAHDADLTRLLLERGADPNDGETAYHSPETYDNRAMQALVLSGKLTDQNLALMLVRKHDWHDYDGVEWLLEHGADPNLARTRGLTPLHHGIERDNARQIIERSLDYGADPTIVSGGQSAIARAARRGRGDLLDLFERRGFNVELDGIEELIAACARNDPARVRRLAADQPRLVEEVRAEGGRLLAVFAGVGNTDGVRHLLDLGIRVRALYEEGDGYFGEAKNSTALHVAAWRANHATVRLLIERGAPVNARDGKGQTPLFLAVKACVDSYWASLRDPESVEALLRAGASVAGVPFPSGYAEVDELLRRHGAGAP